jgi:hypothetical protein
MNSLGRPFEDLIYLFIDSMVFAGDYRRLLKNHATRLNRDKSYRMATENTNKISHLGKP